MPVFHQPVLNQVILCLLLSAALHAQGNNVLVIIADDLGVDQVSTYAEGTSPPPTPNIDALAARGVLFRNAWAYSTCTPSRASFHTGRYGYRTGIGAPGRNANLSIDEVTLPEHLDSNASGYAHALIGKWHLSSGSNDPITHGWSHHAGLIGAMVSDYYNWSRTVDGQTSTSTVYTTTQMADDAISWIGQQTKPWVCFVAFNAPHVPFHAPPSHLHTQSLTGLDPNRTPAPFYRAAVEAMDNEIGRLLQSLGTGLTNTHVIFIGDNGTPPRASESPFTRTHAKGTPYEGGVNVPLIAAGPAVGSGGREEAALVEIGDLFATVAELCGVSPEVPWRRLDSLSFASYLSAPNQTKQRSMTYSEGFNSSPETEGFACARDDRYKLIRLYSQTGHVDEFYDLVADAFETSDLLNGTLSGTETVRYQALAAHILAARDSSGSFVTYGTSGCVGSAGVPLISSPDTPQIGNSYQVDLRSAVSSSSAWLHVGASSTTWGNLALPFDLSLIGAGPGCLLKASGEFLLATTTDGSGNASVSITMPNVSVLVGGTLYHAWTILDPTAPNNPLGIVTTTGAAARLAK